MRTTQKVINWIFYVRSGLGIFHILGLSAVVFTVHVAGLRVGLTPVGFVLGNPSNVAFLLGEIFLAFAMGYLLDAFIYGAIVFVIYETGGKPPNRLSVTEEIDFFGRWVQRVVASAMIYVLPINIFYIIISYTCYLITWRYFLSVLTSFRYDETEMRHTELRPTYADDHKSEATKRRNFFVYFVAISSVAAFSLGTARILHLKNNDLVIVQTSEGSLVAAPIYVFEDSIVVWEHETASFTVLPRHSLRSISSIQQN